MNEEKDKQALHTETDTEWSDEQHCDWLTESVS